MIGWIALILVIGVIILEIYFRNNGRSCSCSGSIEEASSNNEKYRKVLAEIEKMTHLPKPRTTLLAATSLIDDIGGMCRQALGGSDEIQ